MVPPVSVVLFELKPPTERLRCTVRESEERLRQLREEEVGRFFTGNPKEWRVVAFGISIGIWDFHWEGNSFPEIYQVVGCFEQM